MSKQEKTEQRAASSEAVVSPADEKQKLCDAVDDFAEKMKDRLLEKEIQGWKGWENLDKEDLANRMLKNAVYGREYYDQESLIDVANLAMMILRQG